MKTEKSEINTTLLNIHTTTQCTLKCKKCSWSFPMFKPHIHSDAELVIRSLEKVFQIIDYANEVRIAGAEAFLHPKVMDITLAVMQYVDKFGRLCFVTNGSYLPDDAVLDAIGEMQCKTLVRVDDYGKLSGKKNELVSALEARNIDVDFRPYNENEQFFGGWIDLGEYQNKNYTSSQLQEVFKNCKMPIDCSVLWDGALYCCPYCVSGYKLGKIPISKSEFIDLFDDAEDIDQKRAKMLAWGTTPFIGCSYCNGYNTETSPRIPAAEQLK